MSPWGWERRDEPGLVGVVARWWGARRARTVLRLKAQRDAGR